MDHWCARCKSLVSLSDWRRRRVNGILLRQSMEMSRIKKHQRLLQRNLQSPQKKPIKPLRKQTPQGPNLWGNGAVVELAELTIRKIPLRRNRTLKAPGFSDPHILEGLLWCASSFQPKFRKSVMQCFSLTPIHLYLTFISLQYISCTETLSHSLPPHKIFFHCLLTNPKLSSYIW